MKQNLILDCSFDDGNFSDESGEPVTVDEAKAFLKVDVPDDEPIIEELITTARQQIEHYLCISLIQRVVSATIQNDLGNCPLPYCPLIEVIEVKDISGNIITDYILGGTAFKYLSSNSGITPTPQNNFFSPLNQTVTITYSAGYLTLPKHFKTAILQQAAYLYANRGDAGTLETLSPIVLQSLKPYRRVV